MNGWIIALLILAGISAYIGIAALFYMAMLKIFKKEEREDIKCWAALWIVFIPFIVLVSPIYLLMKIFEMIDEESKK